MHKNICYIITELQKNIDYKKVSRVTWGKRNYHLILSKIMMPLLTAYNFIVGYFKALYTATSLFKVLQILHVSLYQSPTTLE